MAEPSPEMSAAIAAYRETPEARRFAALAAGAEGRLRAVPVTPVKVSMEAVQIDVDLALMHRWAARVAHAYVEIHADHPEWGVEEAMAAAHDQLGW
jgi:hypothetical protein